VAEPLSLSLEEHQKRCQMQIKKTHCSAWQKAKTIKQKGTNQGKTHKKYICGSQAVGCTLCQTSWASDNTQQPRPLARGSKK
jgi:hypothetical protein